LVVKSESVKTVVPFLLISSVPHPSSQCLAKARAITRAPKTPRQIPSIRNTDNDFHSVLLANVTAKINLKRNKKTL